MKSSQFILFFILTISEAFGAMSLKEAFDHSRTNMESIKRAQAVVSQSEELKVRARAAVLPTISGVGTYTRIDPPNAAGASPFLLTRQHSYALRLNQPLLRGGVMSAYQMAKDNILLAKYQEDATELNLYQLVINSYYNLAIAQMDVKNVEELLKYSRERVKEIRERTIIGRSRKGELVEAQAQQHIAESQYRQTLINVKQAMKNLEFYTGMPVNGIFIPTDIPKLEQSLDQYVNKIRTRPDIMASQQRTRVANQQVSVARGGHYPQVDLISNYYFSRTGVLSTSDWDVGLAVVIPLFQGGSVQAGVREAVEARRIAELTNHETIRTAERDMMVNYQNLLEIHEQLKSLKEALLKSEETYSLNKKDYKNGLVTNLDVLQSLNVFIETKRSYDSLISLAHMNMKNLEASTGVLP